jgi:hypothetical protein
MGTRILRSVTLVGLLVLLGLILRSGVFSSRGQCFTASSIGQEPVDLVDRLRSGSKQKVNVYFYIHSNETDGRELFVMSKCPDGEDGEATMVNVMEKVGHKVLLNFTYIARYTLS